MSADDCTLAECLDFFDDVLMALRSGFAAMEDSVPKPSLRIRSGNFEVRYDKPSIHHALFLKLARAISLLGGLRLLVQHGMVQEQGILQRTIDEVNGDILFLSFGDQNGIEPVHEEFLEAFWAEEFEDAAHVLGISADDQFLGSGLKLTTADFWALPIHRQRSQLIA